jgi:hypothetical protein
LPRVFAPISCECLLECRRHGHEKFLCHRRRRKESKAKTADAPTVGNWVQTKFLEKDWQSTTKIGILKNDPAEV